MDSFLERLRWAAHGRTFNSWFKTFGWNHGDLERVNKGSVPGPDKLATLSLVENLNVSWLLTGRGAPYLVTNVYRTQDAAEIVNNFCMAHHADTAILQGGGHTAIVISAVVKLDRISPYTHFEIIGGQFEIDETFGKVGLDYHFQVWPPIELEALLAGHLGPWDISSLLKTMDKSILRIAETHASSKTQLAGGQSEMRKVQAQIERLKAPQLELLKVLLRGFEKE